MCARGRHGGGVKKLARGENINCILTREIQFNQIAVGCLFFPLTRSWLVLIDSKHHNPLTHSNLQLCCGLTLINL